MLKKNNFWIIFLFLILTVTFFLKVLFTKTTFIYGDTYLLYYPLKQFLVSNLKNFYIPQWNSFVACGMPTVSDPVQQVFYPLTLVFLFFKFNLAYKLFIISHYFIAGITSYILMRGSNCGTYSSIFSGIAYMFCGYMVFNHSNPIYISSAAWMPLAFYCFIKCFSDKRKLFWSLNCSFIAGMQILGGDIQLVYAEIVFFLVYVLFKLKESEESVHEFAFKWLMRILLIIFFAFLFSAVLVLPIYFLLPFSDRGNGYAFEEATKWSFHPLRIIEFLMPYVFGKIIHDKSYWGMFLQNQKVDRLWTEVIYTGMLPVIFSIYSIFSGRNRQINFFFLLFVLSIILSFGSFTPVYFLLYKTAPFFSSFRYPEKFLIFTSFSLAALGGLGFEKYLRTTLLSQPLENGVENGDTEKLSGASKRELLKKSEKIFNAISVSFIALLAGIISFVFYIKLNPSGFKEFLLSRSINAPAETIFSSVKSSALYFLSVSVASMLLILFGLKRKNLSTLFPAIIILTLIADLWQIGLKSYPLFNEDYYSFSPVSKLAIDKLEDGKRRYFRIYRSDKFIKGYNYPELEGLSDNEKTWIFDKNTLKPVTGINFGIFHANFYGSFQFKRHKELTDRLKGRKISFDLQNIKYVLAPKDFIGKTPYPVVFIHPKGEFVIFKNLSALPRFFIAKKVKTCLTDNEILKALLSDGFKPYDEAIVLKEGLIENIKESSARKVSRENKLKILNYMPNSVSLEVKLKKSGFLVFLENYFPGWEAEVNGKKKDIVRVNYAFMGILLGSGNSRVKLSFVHPGFLLGLKLTTFTLIFYILFLVLHLSRFLRMLKTAAILNYEK